MAAVLRIRTCVVKDVNLREKYTQRLHVINSCHFTFWSIFASVSKNVNYDSSLAFECLPVISSIGVTIRTVYSEE
jgi:hypothetical protein